MGVKNLKTIFKQYSRANKRERIPEGSTLCIDGNGWTYYLYRTLERKYGGEYAKFDRLIRKQVRKMLRNKLNLIVFWDGPTVYMKEDCRNARKANNEKRWQNLQSFCLDGEKHKKDDLPKPPVVNEQLKSTLKELEVATVVCDAEADITISTYVRDNPGSYAYGDDSDYFVFGIPYIQFGDLMLRAKRTEAIVWDEGKISKFLYLNKRQMVELGILLGNDYTFKLMSRETQFAGKNVLEKLLYLQNHEELEISSKNSKLQEAIEFSRDLYNFRPIEKYPRAEKHFATKCELKKQGESLATTALHQLRKDFQNNEGISALQKMIETLSLNQDQQHIHGDIPVNFENAFIANEYQILCRQIEPTLNPRTVYNGRLFHKLADEITKETPKKNPLEVPIPERDTNSLPIDFYKEKLLNVISSNRVTIIQGETGCGKSSRIPQFIYEQNPNCKLMVAQPRRIACFNLTKFLRTKLNPKIVGMRLGMGTRDEGRGCRIWFVTTGYLLQLIGHNEAYFRNHTHIVIDEAHERSVDADVLCFFVKKLLSTNPNIKVIIMSATLRASIYIKYFEKENGAPIAPLFVGSRRFKNSVLYAEDLMTLLPAQKQAIGELVTKTNIPCCERKQMLLIKMLIRYIGAKTSGENILVFLPGLKEIVELVEYFDTLKAKKKYICVPIHSEVPFEEQQEALDTNISPNTIKVILATNAAESSVTFPNVDHVICTGLAKSIQANSVLVKQWISKDSAEQRAGRTGRERPGVVYRLYSKNLYASFREFQEAEIQRIPLDETVLYLKNTLDSDLFQVMEQIIEPVSMECLQGSIEMLYKEGIIATPNKDAHLTPLGALVSKLPISYKLGKIVGLGIVLGIPHSAVGLAAAMSLQVIPFRRVSPLVCNVDKYNKICKEIIGNKMFFDRQSRSQPIMYWNVLQQWLALPTKGRTTWACTHQLAHRRMHEYARTYKHICGVLNIDPLGYIQVDYSMQRFLMTWAFGSNLLTGVSVCNGNEIKVKPTVAEHIKKLLPKVNIRSRVQELWCIFDLPSNSDLPAAFAQHADDMRLHVFGVYYTDTSVLRLQRHGKLSEHTKFTKESLQKLLAEFFDEVGTKGAILIMKKKNKAVMWSFGTYVLLPNSPLHRFGEWQCQKSQRNMLISKEQETAISTLKVIVAGHYNKKFHFLQKKVGAQPEQKSAKLQLPRTQWTQGNTQVSMPRLSVPLASYSSYKRWALCSHLVYYGNKGSAYANNVSVIEDEAWLHRAMLLSGYNSATHLLSADTLVYGSQLSKDLKNALSTEINYSPALTEVVVTYLLGNQHVSYTVNDAANESLYFREPINRMLQPRNYAVNYDVRNRDVGIIAPTGPRQNMGNML
jgi:HrpA-like RNA helicase